MNNARQGWTMLFFLIVISILLLLATNGFKIASTVALTARMRYCYHQEQRLIEGLLTYGIYLCNENKALLLSWGTHKTQTMYLTFNPWPSHATVSTLGSYNGTLTITSQKGSLYLSANMTKNTSAIMTGQCILRAKDLKNPLGKLVVSGWSTKAGG